MDAVTIFFAKYVVFIIVLIAGIYWLTLPNKQKVQMLIFGAIIAIVTFILTRIGSAVYYDARPFVDMNVTPILPHDANNGFPSDHTALAFVAAAAVFYMNRKLGSVLFVIAFTVGASRVVGYIHSPTDIAGSIVFVVIAYAVASYITPRVLKKYTHSSQ